MLSVPKATANAHFATRQITLYRQIAQLTHCPDTRRECLSLATELATLMEAQGDASGT